MHYLQIIDKFLARAAAEYLAQRPQADLTVTDQDARLKLILQDNNLACLMSDSHEIEQYSLPLRLGALLHDVVWQIARERETATKRIVLNNHYQLASQQFELLCGSLSVSLTGREVGLLQFLHETGACSKEKLLAEVWRYHPDSDTHTVETHLWRLRQKLQQVGADAPLIITTDEGYRIA
jgi:DNA-binding response OmpR family regulator